MVKRRNHPAFVGRSHAQAGFTYLWVLMAIAVLGIGLTAVSGVWVSTVQREQREQFEWIGQQYVQAIGSYQQVGAGVYPRSLEDLLEDRRAGLRRHLRQAYPNPYSSKVDWEPVRGVDGGVRGVRGRWIVGRETREQTFVYVQAS
ncbi:MAG: hypothetical protein RLZZ618_3609 [Pseudomonadota bacterium]|jgi:type II secretory pathway pseudopilin PulG